MFRIISSFLKAEEMETIAEMQADDFHLDRALQLACNQVTYRIT